MIPRYDTIHEYINLPNYKLRYAICLDQVNYVTTLVSRIIVVIRIKLCRDLPVSQRTGFGLIQISYVLYITYQMQGCTYG